MTIRHVYGNAACIAGALFCLFLAGLVRLDLRLGEPMCLSQGGLFSQCPVQAQVTQIPRDLFAPEARLTMAFVSAQEVRIAPKCTFGTPCTVTVGNRVIDLRYGCQVLLPAPAGAAQGLVRVHLSDAGGILIYRLDPSISLTAAQLPQTPPQSLGLCAVMGSIVGVPPTERPLFQWEIQAGTWRHDGAWVWLEPPGYVPAQAF